VSLPITMRFVRGAAPEAFEPPNVLSNLSFEAGWDSYTDGGVGDPTASAPNTIARSTDRAFNGTTSVKYTWAANASDNGAAFYRSLGGNYDELWARLYFYFEPAWSVTSVQKWTRFRTESALLGGWFLSDSKGLAWAFDPEASSVSASIIPKASIPTGQWNYLECHYRRNGDAEPNAAFWLNGVPQLKANGADPAGSGLTWLDGRLYAGERRDSTQINMVQHVGTLNGGNTGSGTVYLDYIGVSTAGRIGP